MVFLISALPLVFLGAIGRGNGGTGRLRRPETTLAEAPSQCQIALQFCPIGIDSIAPQRPLFQWWPAAVMMRRTDGEAVEGG